MKTIYLDENYICHIDYKPGYKTIETNALDSFTDIALEYIRYIPEGEELINETIGQILYGPFIQILNSDAVDNIQRQFDIDNENMILLSDIAEIIDIIYQIDLNTIQQEEN